MKREQLEQYRSKKDEIKELKYKMEHLGEGDSAIGNSIINDYRKGYPQPQAVVGVDWGKIDNAVKRYEHRMEKLNAECVSVEEFVENIEDSLTRRIFRMYYIDGISQRDIAKAVGYSRGRVSQKISNFFKD